MITCELYYYFPLNNNHNHHDLSLKLRMPNTVLPLLNQLNKPIKTPQTHLGSLITQQNPS